MKFEKHKIPANYPSKSWPLSQSIAFAAELEERGYPISLIAGPDQKEAWDPVDEASFTIAGGLFCENLFELACRILSARFFVGFDSGPTHLSAQLGKPTFALFGPTGDCGSEASSDFINAEPLGPLVTVIKANPSVPNELKSRLRWLEPREAARRVIETYSQLDLRGEPSPDLLPR